MSFIKTILSILLSVFAPFLLVAAGAAVTSFGLNYGYSIIIWAGLILIASGILWGVIIFLYYGGAE